MEALALNFKTAELQELSELEMETTEGGAFWVAAGAAFLAIGAGAAAGVAIYEAGKATGEFIYHVLN